MTSLLTFFIAVLCTLIFVKAFSLNRKPNVLRVKAPASHRYRSHL